MKTFSMSDFRTYLAEEYPPRSGCCRGAIALLASIAFIALVVLCNSCATEKCIPTTEYVYKHDTVTHWRTDSVTQYERDSVIIREKGDTVFIDHWRDRWREKYVYIADTASTSNNHEQTQTKIVEVVPDYYRYCTWAAWILLGVVLLYIAWRLFKKFYLKK